MLLLTLFTFSCLWVSGLGQLEQTEQSVTRATDGSAQITCKVSLPGFDYLYIYWYRHKPNQEIEHLIYVNTNYNQLSLEGRNKKIEASKNVQTSTSILKVNFLKKEDEATYYCAVWIGWIKIFGDGTKLRVIPSGKRLDLDSSPKPTIFLPSLAETNLHKAGTYLCLLEKFFPDVISVYWKEKGGDKILESQEGNIVKTRDTYMKFSWLTVPEESMDKEHRCIVKHEKNKKGVDQEILFPPIDKANNTTALEACLEESRDLLQLQVTSTSAFYTYLILLFKSVVHLAFIVFCLCRRAAGPGDAPSS